MALFVSLGGRNFGDSPRAIYEYMLNLNFYKDWSFVWAFVDVKKYDIPRGEIVKIDSFKYFIYLLKSKVWICNSGIDRGLKIQRKDVIRVETWHGTPLKKIYGDENKTAIGGKTKKNRKTKIDRKTVRCAQSEKDIELYHLIDEFCSKFEALNHKKRSLQSVITYNNGHLAPNFTGIVVGYTSVF